MKSLSRFLGNTTHWLLAGLLLVLPLFILPYTPESFEINKQYLLLLGVLLAFFAWLGKTLVDKEFQYRRTSLDLSMLALWLVALASLAFAGDRRLGLFGNYENLTYGFISLTVYLLFTFLITNTVHTLRDARRLQGAFAVSGSIALLIFFIRIWAPGILNAMGLTLVTPISALASQFAVVAVVLLLIALTTVATRKSALRWTDYLWGILSALAFVALVVIGYKVIWFIAAVGIFIFLVQAVSRLHDFRFGWITVGFAMLVISLLLTFFGTPRKLSAQLPLEITVSYGTSWGITRNALTDSVKNFLVGSGPAHFARDFSKFRPESFNNNFAWNIRFNDPTTSAYAMLESHGVLGGIAFLALILIGFGTIVYLWMRKSLRKTKAIEPLGGADAAATEAFGFFWSLAAAWVALVVAFFVLHFGTILWVAFWLVTALLVVSARGLLQTDYVQKISLKASPQFALLTSFAFTLVFAGFVVLGIYLGRFYAAEVAYGAALRNITRGNNEQAIRNLGSAISWRPSRGQHHIILARTYLAQAVREAQKTPPQPSLITTLLAGAVNEARRATDLEPSNVANWEALAAMYANARVVAPDANEWVVRSLTKAIELEDSNPTFYLLMGQAQVASRQTASGKKNFEKAIQLKPNYVDAYSALALLEEQEKDTDVAISHMAQAVLFSNQQNPIPLYQVGRMLVNRNRSGDLALAEQALRQAVQINGDYSDALFTLATLMERVGKSQEALALYQKVLKLNPDNAEVKRRINALAAPPPKTEE